MPKWKSREIGHLASARGRSPAAPALHLQAAGCRRLRCGLGAALLGALLTPAGAAGPAAGQSIGPFGRDGAVFPIEDLLQIVVLKRDLLALDAEGGGETREDLELGERVLWTGSRGRVGLVLTDRRILAVGTGSARWQSTRYRRAESHPHLTRLGDRVALVVTDKRALGFNGRSGNLLEERFGPNETVVRADVSANVAIVVTDRRALGLSPFAGGFFGERLRISEEVLGLELGSNIATLRTGQRLLTFRGTTGSWSERRLDIR